MKERANEIGKQKKRKKKNGINDFSAMIVKG